MIDGNSGLEGTTGSLYMSKSVSQGKDYDQDT
jgi:hypothetical protein